MIFFVSLSCLSSPSLILMGTLALILLSSSESLLKLPEGATVSAVYMFGDSIVDTGNNNRLSTFVRSNFPPYGRDFSNAKPTGRFSNGKIPSDLIAEELGIKGFLPSYLDPTLRIEDSLTGVNFASGGAGFDSLTSQILAVISLPKQLEFFKEYMGQLHAAYGDSRTSTILNNSLFIIVAGTDDFVNNYFATPFRRFTYDVPSYIDLVVASASSFLEDLHGLGVMKIGIAGLPPIGCLPSQRTLAGGLERNCVERFNQAARMFNTKLRSLVDILDDRFGDAKVVYMDVFDPLMELIVHPKDYGFDVVDRGCCGTGLMEVAVMCNESERLTCSNATGYVFWDSFHPTEKAYRLVTQAAGQALINGVFCNGLPC